MQRDRDYPRAINNLRSALIEAAWTAIRIDPALMDAYQKLTKRMQGKYAIIRIARKLLEECGQLLLTGQPYQIGVSS
jgi:hypothetical protein